MKQTINILVIILIIAGVIFIQYKYFPTKSVTLKVEKDTIYQDTGKTKYVPKLYPVYIDTNSIDTLILPIDSAEITEAYLKLHKQFYATYFYKDTLKNDSLAFIEIGAKITQNKPVLYTLNYFNKVPTIINNTTHIYNKNELWVGLDVGKDIICPNILFKSKKSINFGVGYNLQNEGKVIDGIIIKAGMNINKIKLWSH